MTTQTEELAQMIEHAYEKTDTALSLYTTLFAEIKQLLNEQEVDGSYSIIAKMEIIDDLLEKGCINVAQSRHFIQGADENE